MHPLPSLLLAGLLLASSAFAAEPLFQPNDLVGICGDSITAQKGYSVVIENYLLMCQPTAGLRVAQFGCGGERATGLAARLQNDYLPFHPTLVTTCYGMNDGSYSLMSSTTGTTYRTALITAVKKFKAGGVRTIILGTPGCVDAANFHKPNATAEQYNQTLGALGDIAREVAESEQVNFADVHHAMMTAMAKSKAAYGKDYAFGGGDGVHASASGHLAMAYAFLKAMGCDGNIGTITLDLASDKAEATAGHKILSVKNGCVEVESTRYPYCFDSDPNPIPSKPTNTSLLPYLPFNEELNRYLLVVNGLKSARAKVTWGAQSKMFSAAALAKGINLAAEFFDNPFSSQFHRVDEMVQAQQGMEISLINDLLHNMPRLKSQDPSQAPQLEEIAQAEMVQDRKMSDLPGERVKPVRHTLKVEATE